MAPIPKRWSRVSIVLAIVCISVAICFAIARQLSRGGPTIIQGAQPISINEVRKVFPPGVPDSAKNIHYAVYAEYVAFLECVRFDAPVDDCIAHAQQVLAQFNAQHPNAQIQGLRPIKETVMIDEQSPLSLPWFDPQSIKTGLVGGERGSHQPSIWIDAEKGIFYYHYSD